MKITTIKLFSAFQCVWVLINLSKYILKTNGFRVSVEVVYAALSSHSFYFSIICMREKFAKTFFIISYLFFSLHRQFLSTFAPLHGGLTNAYVTNNKNLCEYDECRRKAEVNMEGQFLVRQIYDDEITYSLIGAAVEILSKSFITSSMHTSLQVHKSSKWWYGCNENWELATLLNGNRWKFFSGEFF